MRGLGGGWGGEGLVGIGRGGGVVVEGFPDVGVVVASVGRESGAVRRSRARSSRVWRSLQPSWVDCAFPAFSRLVSGGRTVDRSRVRHGISSIGSRNCGLEDPRPRASCLMPLCAQLARRWTILPSVLFTIFRPRHHWVSSLKHLCVERMQADTTLARTLTRTITPLPSQVTIATHAHARQRGRDQG